MNTAERIAELERTCLTLAAKVQKAEEYVEMLDATNRDAATEADMFNLNF
jgi:hypothetical protein